ncbi:MAG: flagellar biosynthetic protein FliR [SAR324 cluster bacterium]|nr:flagellar biosynthetic protein FliR [SAR324 cluster bacterium]
MANLLNYDASQLLAFILVVIRISGIVATAPIFGDANIPSQIKIVIILGFSLIIYPFVPPFSIPLDNVSYYLLLVAGELLIGLVLGMVGQLLFAAVQLAGEMAGLQMGLGMANVMDPQSQQQVSIVAQIEYAFAALIFLAMDAHHVVINAMVHSYTILTPGSVELGAKLTQEIITLSAGVFVLGFQLGAPLIIALFVANIIMGFMARAVPQMNIFVVGFPFSILLGFVMLSAGIPFFIHALRILFELFDNQIVTVLNLLKQP